MKGYSPAFQVPNNAVNQPPDTILTLLIAGSSGQTRDWGSTLAQIVRLSGVTTAGVTLNFWANLLSTAAAAPSTGTTATSDASSGQNVAVQGNRTLAIPAGSTQFSVAALSSGYITAEVWRL